MITGMSKSILSPIPHWKAVYRFPNQVSLMCLLTLGMPEMGQRRGAGVESFVNWIQWSINASWRELLLTHPLPKNLIIFSPSKLKENCYLDILNTRQRLKSKGSKSNNNIVIITYLLFRKKKKTKPQSIFSCIKYGFFRYYCHHVKIWTDAANTVLGNNWYLWKSKYVIIHWQPLMKTGELTSNQQIISTDNRSINRALIN